MRRILRWLIGVPIFLVVMVFAVANRQWTKLSLDPINTQDPSLSVDMPLWLLLFLGIAIGIVVGWFFCWLAQAKWRRLARDRQRDIIRMQNELAVIKQGPERIEAQMLAPLPGIMP